MHVNYFSRLVSLLLLAAFGVSAAGAGDSIVLENGSVRRVLQKDHDTWRTASVSRADGSDLLKFVSDEFCIRLMDGKELTVADFKAAAPAVTKDGATQRVMIEYTPAKELPAGAPKSVVVEYTLSGEPYLRKSLTLIMPENGAVDRLDVERFKVEQPCTRGGRGEPVFIGETWFTGLEYPGAQTSCEEGLVKLAHFPGLSRKQADGSWTIRSHASVLGVGAKEDPLELAFSDYVDTIRRPSRNLLHYNSWYDLQGKKITPANLVAAYESFKKNLLDPYGIKMEAFVPDDGYQIPKSVWVPWKDIYPDGFTPLAKALEERGTRLGIWLPFDGTNTDIAWGASEGYEKSDRGKFYCLVGPRYNAALRDALKRIVTEGDLCYFKHDFNHLQCTAAGHGHLPDAVHGHEANLDAELDLLAYERSLQKDIFLNVTSYVWFSPWWLVHADCIWMCAGDTGYDKSWPQLSPREWDMSYRDHHFYNLYQVQKHLVPVSAMMTHGIIHGRYAKLGGDQETLREWSDNVVMYYGRGVQLKELYISPDMMTPDRWQTLGEATRWAIENRVVLDQSVYIGGDVAKGQVHGYAHFKGDRGILVLRNPDLIPQTFEAPFDKFVRYRGPAGRDYHARVIYPYVEELPDALVSGEPIKLTLPPVSVMVYELTPGKPSPAQTAKPGTPMAATARTVAAESKILADIRVPAEKMQRCEAIFLARGNFPKSNVAAEWTVQLNGQTVEPRRASGPGWAMFSVDLNSQPLAGHEAHLVASTATDKDPFGGADVDIQAFLLADREVKAPAAPGEHLPPAVAQQTRRECTELLPRTNWTVQQPGATVTAAQLATVKAAKLRIAVFGTDEGPAYRDKFIFLNGEKLARIPFSKGDQWVVKTIDMTPKQLAWLKMDNTVTLNNCGGDMYKFSGLALAVQLPDGAWARTNCDTTVQCSMPSWSYAEGKMFKDGQSLPVALKFAP